MFFFRHSRSACDPSNYAKVHNKKKCPVKNCKEKLTTINGITCKECGATVCLRHRLAEDHNCQGRQATAANAAGLRATLGGFFSTTNFSGSKITSPTKKIPPAPSGPSRLVSAKNKVATAAKNASGSITAQLQEYRTTQKAKTGSPAPAAPTEHPETCPQCGEKFSNVQQLIDHAANAHADGWTSGHALPVRPAAGPGAIERCPHCAADFDDPVALVQHVETVHSNRLADSCVLI